MEKATVLIVDSDPKHLSWVDASLKEAGFRTEPVCSAREGLVRAEYIKPDIIITELSLEEHDSGFKLTRQIKHHPFLKCTPVFMITAVKEKTGFSFSLEQDQYWMGVDDYADKPLDKETLLQRVELLLTRD